MINCTFCDTPTKNKKNCSRSCANSYNNTVYPKRKPEGSCKSCLMPIKTTYTYCTSCWNIKKMVDDITLGQAIYTNHHKSSAFALIRSRARARIKPKGQSCQSCGYSKHVEVCHIIPIKDFPLDAKLSDINSDDNLMLLCPNCHWEFDHNLV